MTDTVTKSELLEYWNNRTCIMSSGEEIQLKLSPNWKKEKIEEEVQLFCDRILRDITQQIESDPYWQAMEPEEKSKQMQFNLTKPLMNRELAGLSVNGMSHFFLENIKFQPTRKQEHAMAELGFLNESRLFAKDHPKKSKPLGFIFSDTLGLSPSGDRYLCDGRSPSQVFQIKPDGSHKSIKSLTEGLYLEEVSAYVTCGNAGICIQRMFGGVSVDVFVHDGAPEPSWITVGGLRYRFQGGVEEEDKVLAYTTGLQQARPRVLQQMEEGISLMVAIANNVDSFLSLPDSWLESYVEQEVS